MFERERSEVLRTLGIVDRNPCAMTGSRAHIVDGAPWHAVKSPADGAVLGSVQYADVATYDRVVETAEIAALEWRRVPAPQRGELVRKVGNALRDNKNMLGRLVSLEMGKILEEGLGEVQEVIDICDFSVGLSRQLYGLTMHSERPGHRMYEQWHPLGVVGIISAFNFPVAVWSWNAMLAAVCGNATVWKPSEKVPLCAVACMNILKEVLKENDAPEGLFSVVIGDREVGRRISDDYRIPLVSATGSVRMGKAVGEAVARRLGRSILELGGNNAIIVSREANLKLAVPAILFGAVGTAGQRCTSTRRLIIDEHVYDEVKSRLLKAYEGLPSRIGHPLAKGTLIGPLIDGGALSQMKSALATAVAQGGRVIFGGEVVEAQELEEGHYVVPALVEIGRDAAIVKEETFAPILYLIRYSTFEEAIRINNEVPQGLSSSVFTDSFRESETFLSAAGSDCGIANVNIGTSGAEIGGAFGGEKETGGGRESGSDAWKGYMRRQTNTLNWSSDLPLAQGITFDV